MFQKDKVTGADISIQFCGYQLQSPYILSSGPLTYSSEGMIKGFRAGCGAVVTKTIRKAAAINPVHHMGTINGDSLINCEKWADSDRQLWYEKEIPETVAAGAIVIASVGHTLEEAKEIVTEVEKAGAHIIELVSYTEETLLPMLDFTKANVTIPVICKLSGNWPDPVGTARKCLEHGADGLCAIDSIGPTLKIDIEKARPEMMSGDGFGWMTGAAMRPISMRINAEIARNHPDLKNLYASGGVMSADHAIEFMMAGAMGAGICTVGILKGVEYVEKMCYDLSERLENLGYRSIEEVNRMALPNFPRKEYVSKLEFHFQPYKEEGKKKCISCGKCVTVCCYDARTLEFPKMHVNVEKCRSCGLCLDVCPTGALTGQRAAQTVEDLELEKKSIEFYESVK
ncbi:4Fe-4S binding protein [Lachnospiraceae bacterium LCP25S3_G4]